MTDSRLCPQCGVPLASDAPQGLCPECLLRQEPSCQRTREATPPLSPTTPYSAGFTPPKPEDLAQHFPQLQIIELLGLAPSTVSKHMAVLHQAGLVETRKDGRWIYYGMTEEPELPCAQIALVMARDCLSGDRRIHDDARQLKHIRKMNRADLCVHYKTGTRS